MPTNFLLFLAMAIIWGTTWIAMKAGVTAVPPLFYGACRFILVAAILLAAVKSTRCALPRGRLPRIVISGLLVNVATYGLIFWGMQSVPSGVSGLTNLPTVAIGLFTFAVLFGQEKPTWSFAGALLLGIVGLVVLYSDALPDGGAGTDMVTDELLGAAAIVVGSLSYCLGSVLAKPLLEEMSPIQLTAIHAGVGAVGFVVLSALTEPVTGDTFIALMQPAPLAGLAFLVVFGTFFAYTIYLRLVRDWGAPRAGLYAFVSPVIALILGALVFAEPLGLREIAGAVLMLGAAGFALRGRRPAMPIDPIRPPKPVPEGR